MRFFAQYRVPLLSPAGYVPKPGGTRQVSRDDHGLPWVSHAV